MKYIDADKLKAEVESLKSVYGSKKRVIHGIADGFRQEGMAVMCDIILKIIASLQQEQVGFPTTDKEVEKALASIPKAELPDKYKTPDWLFKQQEQPEVDYNIIPLPEEKAIDAWAIYEYREHPKGLYHTCFVDGYQQGYEQAEKDVWDRIEKYLSNRNPTDYATVGWILKNIEEYKKKIMEE